jgi:hypothetical protein
MKQMYLDNFSCVYLNEPTHLHTKRYLDTFDSQNKNILYL